MRPALFALTTSQSGLLTRAQALDAGCSERELRTLTGPRGPLVTVRRGVYVDRRSWDPADPTTRYALRVRATVLACSRPAVPSHASAAALLGLPLRPHWCDLVHLSRTGEHGGRTVAGVKHHRAALAPSDLVRRDGLEMTSPARTALDIARELGPTDGVVACDAVLRTGTSPAELRAAYAAVSGWPGGTRARAAVDLADGGAENVAESLLRLLVLELGLGTPQTQFEVVASGRRAFVDLRLRRHLIEFDGKVKYLGARDGGVATTSPDEVVWREKQREDWLRTQGYGMSRVIWKELFGALREQTKARLRQDIQRSDRIYGPA